MTTTSVQVCSTSASRWLDTSTVRPVLRVVAQHLAHRLDLRRVEAVGRLVEHQQVGQAQHRLRDGQPLPHALAVGLHLPGDGRAPSPAMASASSRCASSVGRPVAAQYMRRLSCPDRCGRKPDPSTNDPSRESTGEPGLDAVAEHPDVALAGGDQPHEHAQRGGLARAVGAEQAEDLAVADREVHAVDRPEPVRVALREPPHHQRGVDELGVDVDPAPAPQPR